MRPLRLPEAEAATKDLDRVEKAAFEMWEQALRETTERQIRAEADQKIARLKAQFLEKVQDFTTIVDDATAKAEAEAKARQELEARLKQMATAAVQRRPCECCGTMDFPAANLTRISSGQWLCPDCMATLRAEARRAQTRAPAELCEV
jgi:ribosomal protein L37AE/L43A